MSVFYHTLFLVALCKMLYDRHKNGLLVSFASMAIKQYFTSPTPSGNSAKAVRQISGVLHVPYEHNGTQYTLVIPHRKRPAKWVKAVATMENGDKKDVTTLVKSYAGPNDDFYGIPYRPSHLVRNTLDITLYTANETVVYMFVEPPAK